MNADADANALRARALHLLGEAYDLDLDTEGRHAWLLAAVGGDAALLAELARLQAADAAAGPLDHDLRIAAEGIAAGVETDDPRLGQRVGPFVLRERIGAGGMGVVYRAERDADGIVQTVAVKLIRQGIDDAQARLRFSHERQILVRLQHAHIGRFLDGGVDTQGTPWYALEFVDGAPLTHYADSHRLTLDARLALVLQVCEAVQYAHQNLVLHRDLKPANILVNRDGQVKLLDFGIAKQLDDASATQTRQRPFTPDYAAPEQIAGDAVSTACDVYSLGVVIFELLCGGRPARSGDAASTELPSQAAGRHSGDAQRAAALRGDLDTLIGTCLQRDPARRYSSVDALRRDIERFRAGLPIEARPDTLGYRVGKFLRRHRVGTALGALAIIALLAAAAISLSQAQRAEREAARATTLAASAQRERDAALDEVQRQEALREHFAAVLNRAAELERPISADELAAMAANPRLLGGFGSPRMQVALKIALADLALQRNDFPRVLQLLDEVVPQLDADMRRDRALVAATRATALVRVGKLDDARLAVDEAWRAMTPEQQAGGMLPARLETVQGQLQRASGDLAAGADSARRAAALALGASDGSALDRGILIGSAATALLQLGIVDEALRYAEQAEAVWRAADVEANTSTRTVAAVRANVLFVQGRILESLAAMDALDAEFEGREPAPPRAARDSTRAKALALLARPDDARRVSLRAQRGMCETLGAESLDCLRMRLAIIDAMVVAGDTAAAREGLSAAAPALAMHDAPPLRAIAQGLQRVLDTLTQPDAERVAAVLAQLDGALRGSGFGQINARRSLLVLAEHLAAGGQSAAADAIVRHVLAAAAPAATDRGMDASLLRLWQARLAGHSPPVEALADLAAAIGDSHPWWRSHARTAAPAN